MAKRVESLIYPEKIMMDVDSVFIRSNIGYEDREDEQTGETVRVYVYDEEKMSKLEYYKRENERLNSQLTDTQIALVEVYEMLSS